MVAANKDLLNQGVLKDKEYWFLVITSKVWGSKSWHYGTMCITHDNGYVLVCRIHNSIFRYSFLAYHRSFNMSNTTSITGGARTTLTSEAYEFTSALKWIWCYPILFFLCRTGELLLSFCPFSDYPFGFFGHLLVNFIMRSISLSASFFKKSGFFQIE